MSQRFLATVLEFLFTAGLAAAASNITFSKFTHPTHLVECGPNENVIYDRNGTLKTSSMPSLFWPTVDCQQKPQFNVQDEFDTKVDMDGDYIYVYAGPEGGPLGDLPAHPPQFADLWEAAPSACNRAECSDVEVTEQKWVRHQTATSFISMRVEGHLDVNSESTEMRDGYFELLRDAFDRGTGTDVEDGYRREWGPRYLYTSGGAGDYSGYRLRVEFSDDDGNDGCDDVVNAVNDFGALVPHLGWAFGLAGAFCAQLEDD